jgi:hypothetical protein
VTAITLRQRRILKGLSHQDLLWELPGQSYFTQFNERTGKQVRVRVSALEQMAQMGLIRRQTGSAQHLDFWEITAEGLEVLYGSDAMARKAASHDAGPISPIDRKTA